MVFKVKFRGVRGSYPTAKFSHLKYGGNTVCDEVNVRDMLIILDAGKGIIELGENLTRDHILSGNSTDERTPIKATILISHIHQDHIQGLPFFSPIFIKTTELEVFGPDTGKEKLKDTDEEVIKNAVIALYNLKGKEALFEILKDESLPTAAKDEADEIYREYEDERQETDE